MPGAWRRLRVKKLNVKPIHLLLGAALLATLLTTVAWYRASAALDQTRLDVSAKLIEPAAALLIQNQALIKELQAEPFAEKETGILVGYLAKIRRDGLPKHAALKQRLERLADNHVAIVTLMTAYAPRARTPGVVIATEKFRKGAALWRERWNKTMELFMAGGNMPETEVPPASDLLDAVQAERTAMR